jgi:hypothetical protein
MKYIIRIVVVFYFITSTAFADTLAVKFNGKNIKLPYWTATKNPHGAVVLINGAQQAQWSRLLANLAKRLAATGWSAVLVNCNQDNADPWVKSLPEVINMLRQQKNNRVIVVHYGEQLKQTFDSFNKSAKAGIEGLILLSAYDIPKTDDKKPELSMPLLDIAGQFDYASVVEQFDFRGKEFAQNKYLAMKIPGADHDYEYSHQLLLSFMSGWMLRLAEFKPTPPPVLVSYVASIEPLMPKQVAFDEESDWTGFVDDPEAQPTQEITPPP